MEQTEVPGVHSGPPIPHAHAAIPCPDWGLSKGSHPPGEEDVSCCRLEGSAWPHSEVLQAAVPNSALPEQQEDAWNASCDLEAAWMEDTQVAIPQTLQGPYCCYFTTDGKTS